MAQSGVYALLLALAMAFANLPWLSERFLLAIDVEKNAWWRWMEWLMGYGLTGLAAMAVENKVTGGLHPQPWEFYVATLCLFLVLALPGFIYHYDLKKLFQAS